MGSTVPSLTGFKGSTEGMSERVPKFTTLINRTGGFWRAVARYATREGELLEQPAHSGAILRYLWIVFAVRSFQPGVCHQRRTAVSGSGYEQHIDITLKNRAIEVCIDKIETRCRTPVSQ